MESLLSTLKVKTYGSKQNTSPIVFINGFATNDDCWAEVIPDLQLNYFCVTLNLPGSYKDGQLPYDAARYADYENYVADIIQIIDELELNTVNLIGASMGSMIALLCALYCPNRVKKVIVIGASPYYLNDLENDYKGGMEKMQRDGLIQAMKSDYASWVSMFCLQVNTSEPSDSVVNYIAPILNSIEPEIAIAITENTLHADFRPILPYIPCEVLILHSREDSTIPIEVPYYLEEHIPRAEAKMLIGSLGHFPQMTNPEAVISEVNRFF